MGKLELSLGHELGGPVRGYRRRKVIALNFAAPMGKKECELLGRFDAFGDDIEPERARKADRRVDDRCVPAAIRHMAQRWLTVSDPS